MVTRPAVSTALICVGFFLFHQALIPKAMALRSPSNVDRFMTEGHRTHKRKNYMVQRANDDEVMGSIENGIAYDVEPYDPDRNPEELSAFIVDYANMIRNDVILLDKSVETRTRKRGNIQVEQYDNQVIPDPPCSCDPHEISEDLGEDIFPQEIKVRKCSKQNSCRHPYICNENLYNVTDYVYGKFHLYPFSHYGDKWNAIGNYIQKERPKTWINDGRQRNQNTRRR